MTKLLSPFAPGLSNRLGRVLLAVVLTLVCAEAAQKPKATKKAVAEPNAELVKARQQVSSARPLGMYYYRDDSRAMDSLAKHASEMTLLAPQCFWVDAEGFVHGEVPAEIMEIARRAKLPIMPLLVNPGFDRPTASALLHHPQAQERAVIYLAYLARRDNYIGWQLDFEYLDPADKPLYTQFVERVARRLHQQGRLLSIAVIPRFSDVYPGADASGEFHTGEWGAAYDFRALGRVADFLTLMTYNHHHTSGAPGPVAGYDWVKAALDYAVARVPRQRLLVGVPFYGRAWVESPRGTTSNSLAFEDLKALLARPGAEPRWDERWRTSSLQLREGDTQLTAWFDDSRSLGEKLKLMQLYRLRGFAAWRLGVEDPQFWPMLAEFEAHKPGSPVRQVTKRPRGSGPSPGASRSR